MQEEILNLLIECNIRINKISESNKELKTDVKNSLGGNLLDIYNETNNVAQKKINEVQDEILRLYHYFRNASF